jgi:glycosyltransferase involved in cell wall biosynthesis
VSERSVLLTVSGTIPSTLAADVAAGRRPRADYAVMADAFGGAELLDHATAAATTGRIGRVLRRIGGDDAMMAWACFRARRRHTAIFTDSEGVGLLYAVLCTFAPRRGIHIMVGHRLSTRSKVVLLRLLRLRRRIDHVVVYATSQRDVAIRDLGFRPDQVTLTPFMVDTEWWRPGVVARGDVSRPSICAVGQEYRDYHTLAEAVRGLDVDVTIAAASPWSRRPDAARELDIPANVHVTKLSQYDLRQLYAESDFVVVPIEETDFQAGITTILEAMAMGLAVVCSHTSGQTDTVIDEVNGILVVPGDAGALRAAIERLLRDRRLADRLGTNGRAWVVDHADVERYAQQLAAIVRARS